MTLSLVPIGFREACDFVKKYHRHHQPPRGMKFCVAVEEDGTLVGIGIAGRPVARSYQDGFALEVTRVATDGTRHVCSMLYGACWRAAKALGYRRLITYTQAEESGSSLRAAGYRVLASRRPRAGWDTPSRHREGRGTDNVQRLLWEISA